MPSLCCEVVGRKQNRAQAVRRLTPGKNPERAAILSSAQRAGDAKAQTPWEGPFPPLGCQPQEGRGLACLSCSLLVPSAYDSAWHMTGAE